MVIFITKYFKNDKTIQNMVGEDLSMEKHASQVLKRTLMQVSCLPLPFLNYKMF